MLKGTIDQVSLIETNDNHIGGEHEIIYRGHSGTHCGLICPDSFKVCIEIVMLHLRFPCESAEHLFEVEIFEAFHIAGQGFLRGVESCTFISDREGSFLLQFCTAVSAECCAGVNWKLCAAIRADDFFRPLCSAFCAEVCGIGSTAVRTDPLVSFGERARASESQEQCQQNGDHLFEGFHRSDLH